MKQTDRGRQGFIIALALCILAAGVAVFVAGASKAEAQSPGEEVVPVRRVQTTVYDLHTLARSQTLRLSVINAGLNGPPEPVNPGESDPPEPGRLRRVKLVFDVYAQVPPAPGRTSAGDGSVRNLRIVRRESRTPLSGANEYRISHPDAGTRECIDKP